MSLQALLEGLSRALHRHALLLFCALGGLLFAVEIGRRPAPAIAAPEHIAAAQSAGQWLEDEVLYREALARGLDQGDLMVRRRLVQKMRQLLETSAEVAEPSEAQLQDWIRSQAARYGGASRLSLQHVFISRGRHGGELASYADELLARLRAENLADLQTLSDTHPAGTQLLAQDEKTLQRLFGVNFPEQLAGLPLQQWQGPLYSALGLHLVRITAREQPVPDLAAVRPQALRDYLVEQRRAQTQLALHQLKARYGVSASP